MKPALILCQPETGALKVAALTVLDRLMITLARAGCGPIHVVCTGPVPCLKRSRELGLRPELLMDASEVSQPVLVAESSLVVQPEDVRRVIEARGRLVRSDGQPLPLGWANAFSGDLESVLSGLPPIPACGVAERVKDRATAKEASRRLWNGLASESDGVVDTWLNRPLGRWLAKLLVHTSISPNQVSLVSMLIGLVAAMMFATGFYAAGVLGALLFQLAAVVDCVDGDIARILFKETPWGKWIDLGGDQLVHMALFGAIAFGLARQGAYGPVLWLGSSAVAGSLIAFIVVVRGMRRPANQRHPGLQKLIESAATRDFSVVILGLAAVGRLDWLLWMAGIGVHLFWITALALQFPARKGARRKGAAG